MHSLSYQLKNISFCDRKHNIDHYGVFLSDFYQFLKNKNKNIIQSNTWMFKEKKKWLWFHISKHLNFQGRYVHMRAWKTKRSNILSRTVGHCTQQKFRWAENGGGEKNTRTTTQKEWRHDIIRKYSLSPKQVRQKKVTHKTWFPDRRVTAATTKAKTMRFTAVGTNPWFLLLWCLSLVLLSGFDLLLVDFYQS